MKEQTLIEMKNKIETLGMINQKNDRRNKPNSYNSFRGIRNN